MAVIGLSKPFYATYTNSSGTVTYGDPVSLAKACEVSIEVEEGEDIVLYADNGPAETASGFAGGTLTLTIDELSLASAAAILGLTTASSTTPAGTTMAMSANSVAPYLGFAVVVKKQVSGSVKYLAVILHKVQFQTPNIVATTQGENIEFQTPELTATILRDDSSSALWCSQGQFDTEADAITYINSVLT